MASHTAIVFHYEETTFWFSSRSGIFLAYVTDRRQYWQQHGRRMDHPFMWFAATEADRELRQTACMLALDFSRHERFVLLVVVSAATGGEATEEVHSQGGRASLLNEHPTVWRSVLRGGGSHS